MKRKRLGNDNGGKREFEALQGTRAKSDQCIRRNCGSLKENLTLKWNKTSRWNEEKNFDIAQSSWSVISSYRRSSHSTLNRARDVGQLLRNAMRYHSGALLGRKGFQWQATMIPLFCETSKFCAWKHWKQNRLQTIPQLIVFICRLLFRTLLATLELQSVACSHFTQSIDPFLLLVNMTVFHTILFSLPLTAAF